MAPQSLPHEPPLSEVLRELTREPGRDIPINELVERFGSRAFGALLFVFSVACALPLPPGGSTVFGAPLVLLAPQLALGFRSPWLPRGMRHRRIRGADLKRVADRLIPWLCRIERVSRPRLGPMFGGPSARVIGLVCTVLALVLILPIPLGNILPAAAVAALALSLVQRDGALTLLGYLLTGASTAVLALAAGLISRTFQQFVSALPSG